MSSPSGFAYAQARLQSRYSQRADESAWSRLHNIHDLASYLQAAQQTALRPWVLGISTHHSSDEIEVTLRQKYRHHVEEVARWLPPEWRHALCWVKRMIDLPVIHYLLDDGEITEWMKADPELSAFTEDGVQLRIQALQSAGCGVLVTAWQQQESMLSGWLSQWNNLRPKSKQYDRGLQHMLELMTLQLKLQSKQKGLTLATDYDVIDGKLRSIFRRYTFQPAVACAYLAFVAIDFHRLRAGLMHRLIFPDSLSGRHAGSENISAGLQ